MTNDFTYWVGVEQTPNLDTSGNRCAKPDWRYPTKLSAWVLMCHFLYERKVFVVSQFWKLLPDWSLGYQSANSAQHNWKYWIVWPICIGWTRPRRGPEFSLRARYRFSVRSTPNIVRGFIGIGPINPPPHVARAHDRWSPQTRVEWVASAWRH